MSSSTTTPVVYVVDDDTDVLGSLRFLLETDGFDVRTFRGDCGTATSIQSFSFPAILTRTFQKKPLQPVYTMSC
jgi:DNA-binding NtrC family response regulator